MTADWRILCCIFLFRTVILLLLFRTVYYYCMPLCGRPAVCTGSNPDLDHVCFYTQRIVKFVKRYLTFVLCFFLWKLHVTIQKGGSFPELKRCSTCCSAYHCPFCRPSLFRPTKLSKVRAHLDSHFNRAVFHAGKVCKHCLLECIFVLSVNWELAFGIISRTLIWLWWPETWFRFGSLIN